MGLNMAQNLRDKLPAQDSVHIFDVNSASMDQVTGSNVIKAKSAADVADQCETIITMLPEGKHVKLVYDEIAKLNPPQKQKLFIDSSTIDVKTSLETAELLKQRKIGRFVDAPVSGGVVGAKNGTLTFMVGADGITDIGPILSLMGGKIVPCGNPGLGLAAKLANNYLLALTNIATSEAFQLANRLGLDMKLFSQIVNTSSGRCWSSEVNNPVPGVSENTPSSRDYEGGFAASLMNKDLKLAIDAAKLAKLDLAMADKAVEIYDAVQNTDKYKTKDMSIIYKWLVEK
ncbi:hypothetical protein TRVA0_009S01420 [Trichomonascus vanleenenianus]|uniref:uncharacterized protein n=1 Tax=Trichomonascus vanleenenianus TaxID=2268995 RepID=UPI003ECB01E5